MKIITIIEDNPITGVKYGAVEKPESCIDIQGAYKKTQEKIRAMRTAKIRKENTKKK